jgi:hypothetical protein
MPVKIIRELAMDLGLKTADEIGAPPRTRDRRSSDWKAAFQDLAPAAVCIVGHAMPVPATFGDNRGVWPVRVVISSRWEPLSRLTKEEERRHGVHWYGYWFRVWTYPDVAANGLAYLITNAICERAPAPAGGAQAHLQRVVAEIDRFVRFVRGDPLRNAHVDLGPDFDMPEMDSRKIAADMGLPEKVGSQAEYRERHYAVVRRKLEIAIHQLAVDNVIQTWDDAGFAEHVGRIAAERAERAAGRRR